MPPARPARERSTNGRGTTMDMNRRQFIQVFGLAALGIAGAGSLAGCGGNAGSGSSDTSSKLEAIKSRGKLKAGVKKDVIGYGYLNTATNEYEGLEIDLCYQIAAAVLGVSYDEAKEQKLVDGMIDFRGGSW